MDEIEAAAVLAKLRTETCERLGFRIPPEALLNVNRQASARMVDHGLDRDEHFESAASALEAASKHAEEAEGRWAQHDRPTEGWAWDKLAAAYETYWDTVNRTTGFFLEVLERSGVELPRPT
jgi:hypothetical protein